jgi:hypothetical protein
MANIRQATPLTAIGSPNIPLFQQSEFNQIIFNKGYDIILESAVVCPCRGKSGSALPTCQNCLGLGWVFLDPVKTKAIITSINKDTKYKYWSPELTGTVNITVRDEERLSYMDKITFFSRTSIFSEVKPVITSSTGSKFIFCSYNVKSIKRVFLFNSETSALTLLSSDKYTYNNANKRIISLSNTIVYPTIFNGVISIEYEHELSYNVVDLPHDFRSTFISNDRGQNTEYNLPVQGVARRSHIVLGESTNFENNNLIDNN